ncbi:MAG TPA: LysE family translocator [Desulfuromonadales bacterium]|nr:LysE family translocator [Desulfuromonadales bacterium]
MNSTWFDMVSFLLVFTIAIVTPGPNFIMVVNTSLTATRRTALLTALGVAVGSGIFALAGMLGLIVMLKTLPHFDAIAPLIGGGYLVWLGLRMVSCRAGMQGDTAPGERPAAGSLRAFRIGLLTNLSNPKAWAFYLSLFTLVLAPQTSGGLQVLLVLIMFMISLGWYSAVVLIIRRNRFRVLLDRFQPHIQGLLGLLLFGFGLRLLLGR